MFDGKDSGALNHPVTVTSYGEGRATICSGSNDGLWAFNCAGLVVQNLNFVGSGATDSTGGTVIFHRLMADALIKMFTLTPPSQVTAQIGSSRLAAGEIWMKAIKRQHPDSVGPAWAVCPAKLTK